ncbi:hypothetical protein CA265_21165 [Sphingobacteriaceae bacterium GW460-11-11-14-LB5]|nr:hypothetical protein CA265_21165 [Sphingobacteriaceae bacterium GW460-11-11-14-LB5]
MTVFSLNSKKTKVFTENRKILKKIVHRLSQKITNFASFCDHFLSNTISKNREASPQNFKNRFKH